MSKLFLCGHTGSDNHGCEAIVRSTLEIFKEYSAEVPVLATFAPTQDKKFGVDALAELLPYDTYKNKCQRAICALKRKLFKSKIYGQDIIQRQLWSRIGKGDLCLTIGGDTYCYGVPTANMAQNLVATNKGAVSVLWCCTVEADKLSTEVLEDVNRYDLIVARETLTVEALKNAGVAQSKIWLCCDTAFTLEVKETPLPENFCMGNTVGINLSSLVDTAEVFEAAVYLAEKILTDTDMNICLIPHVYNAKKGTGDIKLLSKLKDRLNAFEGRVSEVKDDLSCSELKYIISKCRFFIGARTHSTIAAYSTAVPTLVLGYSMKSKGIAKDLFGSMEDYVLSYKDVNAKEYIYKKFSFIRDNEDVIRKHLENKLPEYCNSVKKTAEMLCERYL